MVLGVYEAGHDVTEPRRQKSEYLETLQGGVAVFPKGSGLFLKTKVIKSPPHDLYITVDYKGAGMAPLSNDMVFRKDARQLGFSVPAYQTDLKRRRTYTVTVKIWNAKGDREPVDTLVQKIRSYVDTTDAGPRVSDRLKQE